MIVNCWHINSKAQSEILWDVKQLLKHSTTIRIAQVNEAIIPGWQKIMGRDCVQVSPGAGIVTYPGFCQYQWIGPRLTHVLRSQAGGRVGFQVSMLAWHPRELGLRTCAHTWVSSRHAGMQTNTPPCQKPGLGTHTLESTRAVACLGKGV